MNNLVRPISLSDLQYHIIPPMPGNNEDISIYNKIFDFWSKQWEHNFSQGASPKTGWKDHFIRQSYISSILHKGEVMCCQLHTRYNINSLATLNSEYFEYIPTTAIEDIRSSKINTLMSMEYLCVSQKWKKNSLGISVGKTIVSLGNYLADQKGIDATIGMPIYGNKVHLMFENVGAKVIYDPIVKYGYNLRLMISKTCPTAKGKDFKVRKLVKMLWKKRLDHTLTQIKKKNAA